MEPSDKAPTLPRGRAEAIGPEGGDARGRAGGRWAVNLIERRLDFPVPALQLQGVQEILEGARAVEVRGFPGHAFRHPQVLGEQAAGETG